MKTIRLFGLIMLTALVFSGCSKSDDDNSVPPNTKGIWLDGAENKESDCFLWINNDVVLFSSNQEEYLNLNALNIVPLAYHPLTKETLYQILSEMWGIPSEYLAQHKEDWHMIGLAERNLSKYKYIVNLGPYIILFNRKSSVNY